MSMLAQMSWSQWLLAALMISVCGFLMLVIMLQRGRGGGLTGAFGGAGGSSAFGAKTGDVFTWITVVVAVLFLVLSVLTNYAMDESAPARSARGTPGAVETTTPVPEDGSLPGSLPGATDPGVVVVPISGGTPGDGEVDAGEPAAPPPSVTETVDETDSAPVPVPPGQ